MPRPGPSILRTPASSTGRARRRLGSVADELLGADFGGTLVTDFYAAYDHFEGTKQRCWAYRGPDAVRGPAGMWRDIDALEREEPGDEDLGAWVAGVKAIWEAATGPRPAAEQGHTPEAARDRRQRAHRSEQQLLRLCPENLASDRPYATLSKHCRRYLAELFTFVRDPAVPPTNNQAEGARAAPWSTPARSRGGTRSPAGSTDRMVLHSLAATARLQGTDPAACFLQVLVSPPTSDSSHTL